MTTLDPDRKRALFEATALPFTKALYNTALRLTGASADASDLVQETFLRAYRTFENFSLGTNCKAWLLTILYSVHINQRRRAQHAAISLPPEELEARFDEDAVSRDEHLPEIDDRWGPEIDRALLDLAEPLRAAILLVDIEQLPYEDAARALGWPVGTLRSRLFRARRRLFATLQEYARATGYLKTPVRPE
jgi:RNA polymerase sigma-70 factor (ECF subfamily)